VDRTTNSAIRFPRWVPQAARNKITELYASPLATSDVIRDLLKRLATYEAMKTEVWEKLPPQPKGFEGTIINWVFFAYVEFLRLRGPDPKTWAKYSEWLSQREKHQLSPMPDYGFASQLAFLLWLEICKSKFNAEFDWPRLWAGDANLSVDKVLEILDQLREFYVRLDEEDRAYLDTLPRINRWKVKGHQKFVTEYLSHRTTETYGQPLDPIVAALAEVAFDLREGVGAETVRGRRRLGKRPEKSNQKPR